MAAGLGFKDFTTGEVLTAADVDGYLMQGVWVFASAAARDAAVTSPQEGNFAYLKDTNVTTYYTGSAWANLDTTGMTNPMTTTGDTIYSSSGSTPARLGIGSTGQVLTVAGGVPSWATPAGGGAMPTFSAYGTATQSINANVYTKITFTTESWDTDSAFASSRFTPLTAGYYSVSAMVGASFGAAETTYWQVYKNGSSWQMGSLVKTTGDNYGSGHILVYLNGSSDYIEIFANSSDNATIGGGAATRYFAAVGIRS
jgi:hypothetical protein